jgi:hypothetical protein
VHCLPQRSPGIEGLLSKLPHELRYADARPRCGRQAQVTRQANFDQLRRATWKRRDVLKLFAASAVAKPAVVLAAAGVDTKADVVVIGAGGAGYSAAITAHDAGARVIVLEKMPITGGNTQIASGGMNAAGTKHQAAQGIKDSWELMRDDTLKGGKNMGIPALVEILARESAAANDWMTSLGADLSGITRGGGARHYCAPRGAKSARQLSEPCSGREWLDRAILARLCAVVDFRLWPKADIRRCPHSRLLSGAKRTLIPVFAMSASGRFR